MLKREVPSSAHIESYMRLKQVRYVLKKATRSSTVYSLQRDRGVTIHLY